MREQLVAGRSFRTEMAGRNRRRGIAFDRHQRVVAMVDELAAADAAVGTDRPRYGCPGKSRLQRLGALTHRLATVAAQSPGNLPEQGPLPEQRFRHLSS